MCVCVCATVIALSEATAAAQDAPPGIEYLLTEAPAYGVVLPLEDGAGLTYISDSGEADHFSFMAIGPSGYTSNDVYVLPDENQTYVRTEDGGGPGPVDGEMLTLTDDDDAEKPRVPLVAPKPTVTVTIYVDQPGTGGDRDPNEGFDVGHTFVEYVDPDTGKTVTLGHYPASDPNLPDDDDGTIDDDTDHDWDVKAVFKVSIADLEALDDEVDKDRNDPPDYDVFDHNCTDWAIEVLSEAGILICTGGTYDPPLPTIPKGKNNCGDLGEDLIEDYGGTRNPRP